MGLFTGRTQRSAQLSTSLAEELSARRTGNGSPVPVGWRGSQAIPAALDAVRLRHDLISTLPVQVYRERPDGHAEQIDPPEVLVKPEANGDIIDWLAGGQKALDLRGNNYGVIVDRDRFGRPTQIELQHPDAVQPRVDGNELLYYRIGGKRWEPRDVWHERCNNEPGSPVGLSVIAACARSLGITLAAEQFGADFFRDGAHPTALLANKAVSEVTEDQAKIVKARFLAGLNGTREPVVLANGWEYQALSVNPNESQFLETMRFGVSQVARIFNVDPELIGGGVDGKSVTYANREQRALDFLAYRLNPTIRRREAALSRLTPRGQFVKLNRGALLATDLLTRYRSYEVGVRNGVLALEEPRELEDRLPLTDEQIQALKDAGLLGKPAASAGSTTSETEKP